MLVDGIKVIEGSTSVNLSVPSGAEFPTLPNIGELFYKTTAPIGLNVYDGSAWVAAGGASGVSSWDDLTDKPVTLADFGVEAEVNTKVANGLGLDLVRYLSMPGELSIFSGKARWYPPKNVNLLSIQSSVDTAPTGSNIQLVLKKNGTIVSGSSTNVIAGQNRSTLSAITGCTATPNDYFTLDVISIGSTVKGSDLITALVYEYI